MSVDIREKDVRWLPVEDGRLSDTLRQPQTWWTAGHISWTSPCFTRLGAAA